MRTSDEELVVITHFMSLPSLEMVHCSLLYYRYCANQLKVLYTVSQKRKVNYKNSYELQRSTI